MLNFELYTPEGEHENQSIGYIPEDIENALDCISPGGSGTFEWSSDVEDVTILFGFDGVNGIIEALQENISFQAYLPGRPDGSKVAITVGGQEGDFPAERALSRDLISEAVRCLPEWERVWEMFEWKSGGYSKG